jgi:hypothetical protein
VLNSWPKDLDATNSIARVRAIAQKQAGLLDFHAKLRQQHFPDGTSPHFKESYKPGAKAAAKPDTSS